MLHQAFKFAAWSSIVLVRIILCASLTYHTDLVLNYQLVVLLLIIPLPLFFASTVFGKRGLSAWVVIGMIWAFASAFTVIIYPLWESRKELGGITRGMIKVRETESVTVTFQTDHAL